MARILAPLLRPAVAAGRLMAPSAAVRSLSVPLLSGLGAGRSAVPPPPESSRFDEPQIDPIGRGVCERMWHLGHQG